MNDQTAVPATADVVPIHGQNSIDAKARPYIDRVEAIAREMESDKGEYMAKCRVNRNKIKDVLIEAKDAGLPVKPLKGVVKYRSLARKQAKIAAGFDDVSESAIYQELVDTLGELGAAAARKAGFNFGPTSQDGAAQH